MMMNPYLTVVVQKLAYKKCCLDFQGHFLLFQTDPRILFSELAVFFKLSVDYMCFRFVDGAVAGKNT